MAPATTSPRGLKKIKRPGFTLLETLLALMLLAALGAVTVVGLSNWQDATVLDEGARQFESLLRMARAEAAIEGKCLRLTFETDDDVEGAAIAFEWEPDPIEAPGEFESFDTEKWKAPTPDERVRVRLCRLTGPEAYRSVVLDSDDDDELQPVVFRPDGSSDSAEIILVDGSGRSVLIELDGLLGSIERTPLSEEELDERLADVGE